MQPIVLRRAVAGVTVGLWIAVVVLATWFVDRRLQWAYVAQHSRRDAPWYYRLAGMWGGSEGSMLLFVAIVAAFGVVAIRRSTSVVAPAAALVSTGALAAVALGLASPFDRLDKPAVRGFGLTPILEHPAMAVHPPLLYCGLGCAAAAALCALDGRSSASRRWLLACASILTLAMALGGIWSYVEQGWGGYWAWDPVENSSMLVWLAALIAAHVPPRRSSGTSGAAVRDATLMAPWILTMFGAALVRSGATPSVHSFARQETVGWALLAVAVTTLGAAATVVHRRLRAAAPEARYRPRQWWPRQWWPLSETTGNAVLLGAALIVVLVGTMAPPVIDLFADRPAAVRGTFFARTVGPIALLSVPFVVRRLRHAAGRVAHVGLLVLIVGVGASTFDREQDIAVVEGESLSVVGLTVTGLGVTVEPGRRADTDAVVATVDINGHILTPSLVAYPERGGVLAETGLITRPWEDIQAVLTTATDDGVAALTIRRRPLTWLIWFGATVMTLGSALPLIRRRQPPTPAVD